MLELVYIVVITMTELYEIGKTFVHSMDGCITETVRRLLALKKMYTLVTDDKPEVFEIAASKIVHVFTDLNISFT